MNLYYFDCDTLVWARTEAAACAIAGVSIDEPPELVSEDPWGAPETEGLASPADLREQGYHHDGERACECCDLYACDLPEFAVCPWCYLCPECRIDCEECGE